VLKRLIIRRRVGNSADGLFYFLPRNPDSATAARTVQQAGNPFFAPHLAQRSPIDLNRDFARSGFKCPGNAAQNLCFFLGFGLEARMGHGTGKRFTRGGGGAI
jgi:hypothetical protein